MLRRYVGTVTVFGIGCGLIGSILLTLLGLGRLRLAVAQHALQSLRADHHLERRDLGGVGVLAAFPRPAQQAQYFVTFSLVDFGLTTALIILLVVGLRLACWAACGAVAGGRGDGRAGPVGVGVGRPGRLSWRLLQPSLRFGVPLLPFLPAPGR